jgi:hypothetical protein
MAFRLPVSKIAGRRIFEKLRDANTNKIAFTFLARFPFGLCFRFNAHRPWCAWIAADRSALVISPAT